MASLSQRGHFSQGPAEMGKATMTRKEVLDLYFMDARCKLLDIAAFLDRVDRASGEADFRLKAFRAALTELDSKQPHRAKGVLTSLSDPSTDPIPLATTKSAAGAWPGGVAA